MSAVVRDELDVVAGRGFFTSWSGGKDSYLALQRAVAGGGRLGALLTMTEPDGRRTKSHALPVSLIRRQAAALGVPLVVRGASWDDYEAAFLDGLAEVRDDHGLGVGVFGDIDLQPHRDWVERVCEQAGLHACLPLWLEPRRALLDELLAAGVGATIVAVNTERLDERFLGRRLDAALVPELEAAGVDACGEEGEFHTVVTQAPLYAAPVALVWRGTVAIDQYRFVDIADEPAPAAPANLRR
ncbi:MAG TPA: diphthine--ammonia ligase [Thermoleophilia bacterium]|nr:diphthine--ammonia ligase [Thermoleophilia bacterium]